MANDALFALAFAFAVSACSASDHPRPADDLGDARLGAVSGGGSTPAGPGGTTDPDDAGASVPSPSEGGRGDGDPCWTCLQRECAVDVGACTDSAGCNAFYRCVSSCLAAGPSSPDLHCAVSCAAGTPPDAAWVPLQACLLARRQPTAECGAQCSP